MIVDQSEKKCSHSACSCDVPAGKAYCSSACEQAAAASGSMESGAACPCGHADCSAESSDAHPSATRTGDMPRQF